MAEEEFSVLVLEARAYLKRISEKRGTLKQVAVDTGISADWVYQFHQGRIPTPSVNYVERVLKHGGYKIIISKEETK